MDPIEKQAGVTQDNFWHRAKLGLIGILLDKAGGKGKDILVIGCGTGDDMKVVAKYARRLVVCDINQEALEGITGRAEKICCDATALPLKENSFDAVLSFDVFEHIQDDKKAISECRRVLKKGGKLIFTVPAWSMLYSGFDKQVHHVRRYNRAELKRKLAGLKIFYISYWNFILFPLFAVERSIKKAFSGSKKRNNVQYGAAKLPKPLNELLYLILIVDNYLIKKGARLPYGLSLCGICLKK